MNFNETQSKAVYDFVMRYNSDEQFNKVVQKQYNSDLSQLSILQIYALEEVLRFGTKGVYGRFLETKGTYTEDQAVDLYDGFVKLLNEDVNFKQYKTEQLTNAPETLSEMEMFAFTLAEKLKVEEESIHEEKQEELEYDPFTPILYSSDKQTRETLENLFFGEFIHKMLELPSMQQIKDRQKVNGQIAKVDKPIIIEQIQDVVRSQESMGQFKQVIDQRYVKVKMDLLLGKGESAFDQYAGLNTNITASEILGIEKDNTADDIYAYLKDIVNKRKSAGETFTQVDATDVINKARGEGQGKPKR